mmetsp:Transcript_15500/g.42006  ORF Transcript_15500/g.42006 Transcript_15500/m.42006 type:complete len:201 (-) Transcript_15500:219-821(-)
MSCLHHPHGLTAAGPRLASQLVRPSPWLQQQQRRRPSLLQACSPRRGHWGCGAVQRQGSVGEAAVPQACCTCANGSVNCELGVHPPHIVPHTACHSRAWGCCCAGFAHGSQQVSAAYGMNEHENRPATSCGLRWQRCPRFGEQHLGMTGESLHCLLICGGGCLDQRTASGAHGGGCVCPLQSGRQTLQGQSAAGGRATHT